MTQIVYILHHFFLSIRHTVSGHWSLIHDAESSITHYAYYIGTSPNDDSYVSRTMLPPSQNEIFESSPFNDIDLLPISETIYITLEVYNGVGMSGTISSRGVVVSDVPPVSMETPFIDVDWSGSHIIDTQYVNSALRLNWNFSDPNLMIDKYFWSLVFEQGTYQLIQPQISHKGFYETLSDLDLTDGTVMSAVIIACNQAGLCAQNIAASNITIDSSSPIDGYFALDTNTSASLPWAVQDGMNIYNGITGTTLNLTFTGFLDPQTGITEYWAIIGSKFMSSDLYEPSGPLSNISYHSNSDVLISTINLSRNLSINEMVYISLWAVNGVGLRSNVVQGTFQTTFNNDTISGSIRLMRSQLCPIESCVGHCTCSERGHLCDGEDSCTELNPTELANNQKLVVSNFVPQLSVSLETNEPLFTSIADKLVATVEYAVDSSSIEFIDWSVGEQGKEVGSGVIDTALDPVWFPLVLEANPIFHVSKAYPLVVGKKYVFYVRAWYSTTDYAIFESDGVIFDDQGPLINKGYRVKEVMTPSSTMDIDYSSSLSELNVKWTNVFSKQHSTEYSTFEICIGTSPGSDNVYPSTEVNDTSITLTGLPLVDNTFYYTSVKAMNKLGITAMSISDGFLVDITPPEVGVVFDGKGHLDKLASTSSDTSYARIFGFNDPHSSISSFSAKFQTPYSSDFPNINKEISRSIEVSHGVLPNGNASSISVTAYNRAGMSSDTVTSTGTVYDSSPPILIDCDNVNMAQTSSFDSDIDGECICTDNNWSVVGEHTLYHLLDIWTYIKSVAKDSCCALELAKGSFISQTVQTVKDEQHTLSFWVLHTCTDKIPTEVLVECNGEDTVILKEKAVLRAPCDLDGSVRWQKVVYVFTANSDQTTITITAPFYQSIIIDYVKVEYCQTKIPLDSNDFQIEETARPDHVTWYVVDFESNIAEYQYAIGTVKGGEQISQYRYTGSHNWGFYDLSEVKQNTEVYFSVKATNKAGSAAIFYSEPLTIDETPPVVSDESVKEILELGGTDVDYSKEEFIVLDWSGIIDEESSIDHCIWALGKVIINLNFYYF